MINPESTGWWEAVVRIKANLPDDFELPMDFKNINGLPQMDDIFQTKEDAKQWVADAVEELAGWLQIGRDELEGFVEPLVGD
jgi:hypothetical protein